MATAVDDFRAFVSDLPSAELMITLSLVEDGEQALLLSVARLVDVKSIYRVEFVLESGAEEVNVVPSGRYLDQFDLFVLLVDGRVEMSNEDDIQAFVDSIFVMDTEGGSLPPLLTNATIGADVNVVALFIEEN